MVILPNYETCALRPKGDGFLSAAGPFVIEICGTVLVGYQCFYRTASYQDGLFSGYGIVFPPQLTNAVAKRRGDYLAGRFCAQRVLEQLGFGAVPHQVGIGPSREPVWPPGVVGSFSHSGDRAVCIATTEPEVIGVGIDLEKEIPDEIVQEIRHQIIDATEDSVLRSQFPSYNRALTIAFSGKETIYKAMYPQVRRFFDFSAVKVVGATATHILFFVAEG